MDSDFGLREWRIQVWLAAHPSAACPDVSLADKAAGRPQKQITDHPEWDVLFIEGEYILKLRNTNIKYTNWYFIIQNANNYFLCKNYK